MTDTQLYGIKNCDTMKKAFKWLDQNNIGYNFHDYKKEEPSIDILTLAIEQCGWENVINKRGTTWRKLPQEIQDTINDKTAAKIARDNPSVIKRPLLIHKNKVYLGFKEELYNDIF